MILRLGTRGSKLAVAQAQWVREHVSARHPELHIELVTISTKGDKIRDRPLSTIGGKGLFVKEIEEAIQRNEIDVAVHSLKDVPAELPADLYIGVIPEREDPYDVIISKENISLEDLPEGSRIGTSSLRRAAQLLHYRPDLTIVPMRGNLDTRIRKLHSLDIQAIVVAAAGLKRMHLIDSVTEYLPPDLMLPAVAQGALGLELRRNDRKTRDILTFLDHYSTRVAVEAERSFLRELKGGCQVPVAALGRFSDGAITMQGMVADIQGNVVFRDEASGPPEHADLLGASLARRLLDEGARGILEDIFGSG
jgi:hydroxymethylbilane synthase